MVEVRTIEVFVFFVSHQRCWLVRTVEVRSVGSNGGGVNERGAFVFFVSHRIVAASSRGVFLFCEKLALMMVF